MISKSTLDHLTELAERRQHHQRQNCSLQAMADAERRARSTAAADGQA
ncbi:hypothetical protein [Baekduia soli]|nr:hypothetical protein [Baekduia soli]